MNDNNIGSILGGVIGGVLLIALPVIAIIIIVLQRKKKGTFLEFTKTMHMYVYIISRNSCGIFRCR